MTMPRGDAASRGEVITMSLSPAAAAAAAAAVGEVAAAAGAGMVAAPERTLK